ncbi:MAG: xanthine dehydrogenase family protein subunit M [Lewinellaceae bacterium]|nr:xanthine dehydrogenase family protein subunit M [Lewinellaceae bacterium]
MIPTAFAYKRAHSVEEALSLLAAHGEEAKILAGGHSLIPALKLRLNQPEMLIDIARIPALRYIRQAGDHIAIGAATTHDDIAQSDLLQKQQPIYPQAAKLIGDIQVRNRGTLGGSIAHADPSADWPAVLLATDAQVVIQSAQGERVVGAADFFTGFYSTALEAGELVTEIQVPLLPPGTKASYQKFMQPASRFAIVGCAAVVTQSGGTCSRVRVAFTGLSDAAFRDQAVESALTGKAAGADEVAAAAQTAGQDVMVLADHFASEDYRLHLARVIAKRALTEATH